MALYQGPADYSTRTSAASRSPGREPEWLRVNRPDPQH